jgi:hypothetical protein
MMRFQYQNADSLSAGIQSPRDLLLSILQSLSEKVSILISEGQTLCNLTTPSSHAPSGPPSGLKHGLDKRNFIAIRSERACAVPCSFRNISHFQFVHEGHGCGYTDACQRYGEGLAKTVSLIVSDRFYDITERPLSHHCFSRTESKQHAGAHHDHELGQLISRLNKDQHDMSVLKLDQHRKDFSKMCEEIRSCVDHIQLLVDNLRPLWSTMELTSSRLPFAGNISQVCKVILFVLA